MSAFKAILLLAILVLAHAKPHLKPVSELKAEARDDFDADIVESSERDLKPQDADKITMEQDVKPRLEPSKPPQQEIKPRPEIDAKPQQEIDANKPQQEMAKPQQNINLNVRLQADKPQDEPEQKPAADHYDQRQNGTENYRVRVDGLVFILAPADSLLLAGAAALEPGLTNYLSENKPQPKPEQDPFPFPFSTTKPEKPIEKEDYPKSSQHQDSIQAGHKPALRITSLIAPFLNKLRQAQHHVN